MTAPGAAPRGLWWCAAAFAGLALGLAALGPVPAEDGVGYLWLAQRFAAGEAAAALASPFPPGWPLLLAPWLWLGAPAETAAAVVGAACLGLALWPVWQLGERLAAGAGWPAVLALLAVPLLPRLAAEGYSEPAFLLLTAHAVRAGLAQRWGWLGGLAAAAFWLRPEGCLVAVAFAAAWLPTAPRRAIGAVAVAGLGPLLLAGWRASLGLGFDPLPIAAFHAARTDLPQRGDWLANLPDVPGAWLEAFGVVAVLVFGAIPARRRLPPHAATALWLQVGLQVAVVLSFVVRRRFFVSAAVPVAALAGVALAGLPPRRRRLVLAAALLVALLGSLRGGIPADRAAERALGDWLRGQLRPGEAVVADLPRVVYFAGLPPPPPRHFAAAELLALAAPPAVRFVVLSERSQRGTFAAVADGLAGAFDRAALPAELAGAAGQRGIAVFVRR